MEPEIAGLIRIFDSMSTGQQEDAMGALNAYLNANQTTRDRMVGDRRPREIRKVDVGPVGAVCPYCGR